MDRYREAARADGEALLGALGRVPARRSRRSREEALSHAHEEVRGRMEKGVHEGHEVRKARLLCHTPQHDRPRNGVKAVATVKSHHNKSRPHLEHAACAEDEHRDAAGDAHR